MILTSTKKRQIVFAVASLTREIQKSGDENVTHYENCTRNRDCVHVAIRNCLGGVQIRARVIQHVNLRGKQVNEATVLLSTEAINNRSSYLTNLADMLNGLYQEASVLDK